VHRRRTHEVVTPSIFDVAHRAGVSASTVSRSLRGMPNVAPATRERVARAAEELSYVASPAASGLASGRTTTVGVVVPFVSRWFFMQVVQGAGDALRAAGFDLLLYQLGDASGRERFFDRLPLNRKVDGALLVDIALQPDEQARLQALGIPITVVGGAALGVGTVGIDDDRGVSLVVQHLASLGHRSIGMLCGRAEEGLDFAIPERRRQQFLRATADAKIDTRSEWMVTAPWGLEGGAQAMHHLLGLPEIPTAVFAESDEIAFGAMRTLRRAGIDVPGQMSVVGFDDHELSSVVDLTTIAQPVPALGAAAAELLLDALRGQADPFARVVLPVQLVVRGSTAPPA
jgi:LacI family repressor for deo operon, udp, cdd, tsx, nupC, and nupG